MHSNAWLLTLVLLVPSFDECWLQPGGAAMCFLFSLIPATIFVIVGYFVLFSATKAEGPVQIFGYILSIWVFIIAAFFPTMRAYVTLTGLCPSIETMMKLMHSRVSP